MIDAMRECDHTAMEFYRCRVEAEEPWDRAGAKEEELKRLRDFFRDSFLEVQMTHKTEGFVIASGILPLDDEDYDEDVVGLFSRAPLELDMHHDRVVPHTEFEVTLTLVRPGDAHNPLPRAIRIDKWSKFAVQEGYAQEEEDGVRLMVFETGLWDGYSLPDGPRFTFEVGRRDDGAGRCIGMEVDVEPLYYDDEGPVKFDFKHVSNVLAMLEACVRGRDHWADGARRWLVSSGEKITNKGPTFDEGGCGTTA